MVNRANGTRANDHRANGNRADVVAPFKLILLKYLSSTTLGCKGIAGLDIQNL